MKLKTVFLVCVFCLVALIALACLPQGTLLPYEGSEFELRVTGAGSSTFVSFRADDGDLHKFDTTNIEWYYDRPNDSHECAIVIFGSDGEEIGVEFHLLESKNPESRG